MGNLLSCLPLKKRDVCTDSVSRKGKYRRKETKIERIVTEKAILTKELDVVKIANHDVGIWKLEDIELEKVRDTGTNKIPQEKPVDSGSAFVISSHPDQPETEVRGLHGLRPQTPVKDKPSPRRRAKDSECVIRVSLRQAHEDYTRRINKQRNMTRSLLNIDSVASPSSAENIITDTDKSHGDIVQNDAANDKYFLSLTGDKKCTANKSLDDKTNKSDASVDITSTQTESDANEIAAIFKLARDINNNRTRDRKKKMKLLREYKKHDLRTILENAVGEKKAEIRDTCSDMIDMCIAVMVFGDTVNHWCNNALDDKDDNKSPKDREPGESSDGNSPDKRLVKLETLFENAIEEEREEIEDFCSNLILHRIDVLDY